MEHISELIALLENRENVLLSGFPLTIRVNFIDSERTKSVLQHLSSHSGTPSNLSLHILHIRGFETIPLINVYLNNENNPSGEEFLLGSMALYGLQRSSQPGGIGLHEVWNVTKVFELASRQKNWSDKDFTLTFVPQSYLPENSDLSFERIELRLDRIG